MKNPTLLSAELNRIHNTARELIRLVPPEAAQQLVHACAYIAAADALVAKHTAHGTHNQPIKLNPSRN